MHKFLESEGFRTRLLVCIGLVAVLVPAYLFLDGIILKILIGLGFLLSMFEIGNVGVESRFFPSVADISLAGFLGVALLVGILSMGDVSKATLGTAIVACVATDVGAYLFGNLFGGRLIKSRPFPTISPKKTWEGSVLGVLFGFLVLYIWTGSTREFWMVPVAFVGDVLESIFKRRFGVKDSNDFLIESDNTFVRFIEGLLGGRNGHGGYFDRLDSLALVLFVQTLIAAFSL